MVRDWVKNNNVLDMKKSITCLLFLILLISKSFGQVITKESFIEIELPIPGTTEWYKLNNKYEKPIRVFIDSDTLKIELIRETSGDTKHELSDGLLLSKNRGEFGGGLFYKPFDKKIKQIFIDGEINKERVKLSNIGLFSSSVKDAKNELSYFRLSGGNINSFFKFKDTLYFTSGLAHMLTNTGTLTKLATSKTKFAMSKVLDLEGAPMTEVVINDTIIFITFDGLLVVKEFQKIINLKKQFWASLYPNSVVYLDKKSIYIGMRGCYAKVDLTNNTVKCFKLKD
ncbi:hypothetical protein D3C87_212610 [compost metagenome]